MFLVPGNGKVFVEYDEKTRKLVRVKDVTQEMLDRNLVYEISADDLAEGKSLCPTCQRLALDYGQ